MRNTAFLAIGIGLLVLQSNLFRLIGRFQISGATPSLLLPLVVFMGVHEYSIARGAALAFLLGYLLDLFSAAPIGLFTFISEIDRPLAVERERENRRVADFLKSDVFEQLFNSPEGLEITDQTTLTDLDLQLHLLRLRRQRLQLLCRQTLCRPQQLRHLFRLALDDSAKILRHPAGQ